MQYNSQMTQIWYEITKTRKQKVKHIVQNINFIKIKSGVWWKYNELFTFEYLMDILL